MTGFVLKLVALITMVIDHTGATLQSYGSFGLMRSIGRIAFPIYAFLISEGLRNTRNIRKYLTRLLVFAFISQFPFDLLFENIKHTRSQSITFISFSYLNVFFTLFVGGLAVYCYNRVKASADDEKYIQKNILALFVSMVILNCAGVLNTDYGFYGALLIFMLYSLNDKKWQIGMLLLFIFEFYAARPRPITEIMAYISTASFAFSNIGTLFKMMGVTEMFAYACVAPLLVCFYNGKRGPGFKWFFYAAYPLHLLILAGIWFFYLKPLLLK